MSKVNKVLKLDGKEMPKKLSSIADPPKKLFVVGERFNELISQPCIAIVGTRSVSPYGRYVTEKLTQELAKAGVVIISGLALGVDSIAHAATLAAGGKTIAVLPGGIDKVYPRSHELLAREILAKGGCLVAERETSPSVQKFDFLIRNRLISALSDGVLIPEAAIRSGSLNTARHALEQGRTLFAVPGNITSDLSAGTNNLLKLGAVPVTDVADIYNALGWQPKSKTTDISAYTKEEQAIISVLKGKSSMSGEELLVKSKLSSTAYFETMTMLEINGVVKALGGNQWTLS